MNDNDDGMKKTIFSERGVDVTQLNFRESRTLE
jgi:hypothetical protein